MSTAESNMSPGMLSTDRDMLSLKVVKFRTHQDRPWTSNNPIGKSHMGLDPGRMDMENVVYRMQCVVHDEGVHIERSVYPHRGNAFID
ncbi:hypothetical protein AVEN_157021-1 [Araneus ventricosus]|uniref:Uncharacterized protein n=1 Tax=Araneus ventricosus TaxID=182803 RepID=A0A4Y2GW64_ARAVE|nr:hypothetical protein AVEN_157021-1 [Araneus ventricosus]